MKIIFSGGGTLGPVMPLIAIFQELKKRHPDWEFLWVGAENGPEKETAKKYCLDFVALPAAKWRRYFSGRNLATPFIFLAAFIRGWQLIKKWQPDLLISAGGFVSVPLHLAAWFLKKKNIIHQQDIQIGLASRLMAPWADFVTVAFERLVARFPVRKTLWLGNPVRPGLLDGKKETAISHFHLEPNLLTVLVLGGGNGALSLNKLVVSVLVEFIGLCQVIHMTGQGKEISLPLFKAQHDDKVLSERYHPVRFLDEEILKHALAVADLVISRAGLSTLSELSVLGKPILLAPLVGSAQIANAEYFAERADVSVFYEDRMNRAMFVKMIRGLLEDNHERLSIGHKMSKIMPAESLQKMCLLIEEITKN